VAPRGGGAGGAIAYPNPAAAAVFGYDEREFRRVAVDTLFAKGEIPADVDNQPREVAGLRRTGEDFPMEVWRGTTIVAGTETEIPVLCIKDITWRKEKEEGLDRPQSEIRRHIDREIGETAVQKVVPGAHAYVLGSEVAATVPTTTPSDWFGYLRDDAGKALTFFSGEVLWQPGSTASLLSG